MLPSFHYPVLKTPEYVEARQSATNLYANAAAAATVCFLCYVALQNMLIARGFWIRPKVLLLRHVSAMEARQGVQSTLWAVASSVAHAVYLHQTTLSQIVLWLALYGTLLFVDTHEGDLIYIAKRLGRMTVVLLPAVFFLTLRPLPLPNTLYLNLLPVHKWLLRALVLMALIHTALYLGMFCKKHTWAKAYKLENVYGWAALVGFLAMALTSLLRVRDRCYKLFFVNHYVWSWVIVLALPFHVRPINTTAANVLNVLLLVYQAVARLRHTVVAEAGDFKVVHASPNLAYIEFSNTLLATPAQSPGAHIRLTNRHPFFLVRWFKLAVPNYHPYTLASLPQDRVQKLVVRKSLFVWDSARRYIVHGLFDPKLLFVRLAPQLGRFSLSKLAVNAKKLLVVVGGSAISFALPLLRVANYHGVPAKVVWVVRDYRDIAVLRQFDGFVHGDDFEIFVTAPDVVDGLNLRGAPSYGTFKDLVVSDEELVHQEVENVDVDLLDELDDENGCTTLDGLSIESVELEHMELEPTRLLRSHSVVSRASRQSTNERFVPSEDSCRYHETVKRLHLENRIYRGRPKLNYRYYNWCVTQSDVFTQCSGPVVDGASNIVCCKDLPGRHSAPSLPDAGRAWVISAGPKSLVRNVKLWASENSLKYHEESFYV